MKGRLCVEPMGLCSRTRALLGTVAILDVNHHFVLLLSLTGPL